MTENEKYAEFYRILRENWFNITCKATQQNKVVDLEFEYHETPWMSHGDPHDVDKAINDFINKLADAKISAEAKEAYMLGFKDAEQAAGLHDDDRPSGRLGFEHNIKYSLLRFFF